MNIGIESASQSSSANSILESYPQKLWSPPAEIEFGDPYDSTCPNFMLWVGWISRKFRENSEPNDTEGIQKIKHFACERDIHMQEKWK